MRNFTWNRFIY